MVAEGECHNVSCPWRDIFCRVLTTFFRKSVVYVQHSCYLCTVKQFK